MCRYVGIPDRNINTFMRQLRMNLFISRLNWDHSMISSSLLYWGGPSVTDFTFGSTTFGSSFFSSFLSSIVLSGYLLLPFPFSFSSLLSLLRSSSHRRSTTSSSFCTSYSLLLRSKYSVLDQPLPSFYRTLHYVSHRSSVAPSSSVPTVYLYRLIHSIANWHHEHSSNCRPYPVEVVEGTRSLSIRENPSSSKITVSINRFPSHYRTLLKNNRTRKNIMAGMKARTRPKRIL